MADEVYSIENIIEDLNYNYMSIEDYYKALDSKLLIAKDYLEDDISFQRDNPLHPLSMDNRFRRIDAADALLKKAQNKDFNQNLLDIVHKHLFDCCSAVRLSLVRALLYVGNETSVKPLEALINVEKESNAVKNISNIVLDKIVNNKSFIEADLYLYVGDIKDNNADGIGKMYYKHNGQIVYEGEFKNNKFHGEGIYYNDDGSIRYKGTFEDGRFIG